MENNNEKTKLNLKEFATKYGAYLVIMLVITAAAIVSVFAFPQNKRDTASKSDNTAIAEETPVPNAKNNASADKAAAVENSTDERIADILDPETGKPVYKATNPKDADALPEATPIPDFTAAPTETPAAQELLSPPVNGEVIWDYAMNELIYSATLDQWTTHCGVDIACKQGDVVRAVADGRAESVYEDDAYGITVVIVHKNGHKTVYSNLAQNEKLIKAGATVKKNDVIGCCGKTAKFECADKSHIHFEYHVNGKPVNPNKYVRFKKAA